MSIDTRGPSRRTALRLTGVGIVGTAAAASGVAFASPASAEPRIVPRFVWGFEGWREHVDTVAPHERTHFVVHYQGGPKRPWHWGEPTEGTAVPLSMDRAAKSDGDKGIEYNFVITQKGEIFEGRGFDLLGGAIDGFNTPAISVQLHFRKGDKPSQKALHSLRWLYAATNRELGSPTDPRAQAITRALLITGHQDHNDTECPGVDLMAWVHDEGPGLRRDAQRALDGLNRPPPKPDPPKFPGRSAFRVGKRHSAVVDLDKALIRKGYDRHHDGNGYQAGRTFTESTRRNVRDFQRAQGWTGSDADGYPGPQTWKRLVG